MGFLNLFSTNTTPNNLQIIGVTGFIGKTSTAHLIYHGLKEHGIKVACISSFGSTINGEQWDTSLTSEKLNQKILNKLIDIANSNNCAYLVLEVEPDTLANNKISNLNLKHGVITNISNEQGNFDTLVDTKLKFIKFIDNEGSLVLNADQPEFIAAINNKQSEIENMIYLDSLSNSTVEPINYDFSGIKFKIDENIVELPVLGHFNTQYVQYAFSVLKKIIAGDEIAKYFGNYSVPAGKLEIVGNSNHYTIIDNAYTPEMLESALSYLSFIKNPSSKIICVLGSAGEEDKSRRKLSLTAQKYANIVLLTAEDPKGEKVADINSEIFSHVENRGAQLIERLFSTEEFEMLDKEKLKKRIRRTVDNQDIPFIAFDADHYSARLDAIELAHHLAEAGDIVYITRKSTKNIISFGKVDYEWSDHEAVRVALEKRKELGMKND